MSDYVRAMLEPRSIAIVGASADTSKFAGLLIPNLRQAGYRGAIYPVNPNRDSIQGIKCYSRLTEVPGEIDLSCIVTPARLVPAVMKDCAAKRVNVAVIMSGGFGERGPEGKELENQVVKIATEAGIRVCGPNCEGEVSMFSKAWVSWFILPEMPSSGDIALISQSGGVGERFITYMNDRGLGLGAWISTGNEIDLDVSDFVDFFAEYQQVRVVCLFIEGLKNGRSFKKAAEHASLRGKPIIVVKMGKSEESAAAIKSHTGALAGNDAVYDALFRKYGITAADTPDQMFETAAAFSLQPIPQGDGVAIITDSGGYGGYLLDSIIADDLKTAKFTSETKKKMESALVNKSIQVSNPMDLGAGVSSLEPYVADLRTVISVLLQAPEVNAIAEIVSWWPIQQLQTIVREISSKAIDARSLSKPILGCLTAVSTSDLKLLQKASLDSGGMVPFFSSPEKLSTALAAMYRYSQFLQKLSKKPREITSPPSEGSLSQPRLHK